MATPETFSETEGETMYEKARTSVLLPKRNVYYWPEMEVGQSKKMLRQRVARAVAQIRGRERRRSALR